VGDRRMKLSLIAVCHHSSKVLPGCVQSFRREAMSAGVEAEVLVVEQSENDGEANAAEASRPDAILRQPNRGYAAGLNAGVRAATGDVFFLANPDIEFLRGSVGALVDAATGGASVAGPQLLWDRGGEIFLPIPDDPSPRAELLRALNRRRPTRRALERAGKRSWAVWSGEAPCRVPSLRGPLLALSRDAAARLGPMDEGYFLYYEETEWLWRALRSGAELVVAPQSRVVHRWGHSTRRNNESAAIEDRSRARFFERNYPRPYRILLERLAPKSEPAGLAFAEITGPAEIPAIEADIWLASIVNTMQPSIGGLGTSKIPPAIHEIEGVDRWYAVAARRVNSRWRLQGRWTWQTI
jgi:GT2 family glycosyltransferase